jgi:hypothetical protein
MGWSDWSQDTWNFSVASGGVSVSDIRFYAVNGEDIHICVPVSYGGIQGLRSRPL